MAAHLKLRRWPMRWPMAWLTGWLVLACAAAAVAAQGPGQLTGPGPGPGVGTGTRTELPKTAPTPAQAMVQHHETLRKCWRLDVAAVRHECQRQAQRTLDQQTAQWQRQRSYPWQGDGAAQPAITLATGASRSR